MSLGSIGEKDSVTFVWAIENLIGGWSDVIQSPVFVSKSLDNTKWKMNLQPYGTDDSYISLDPTRCDSKTKPERVVVDCKLSIVDNEGSPLNWKEIGKHGFRRGHRWLCQRFVERTEVFVSRKSDYLPLDTLTVNCQLRRSFNEDTESEIRFSRTKIEKISFFWIINDFCYLKPNQRKSLQVKKTDSETQFLTFDFVIEDEGNAEIDITSTEYQRLSFLCNISLIDNFGRVFKCQGSWCSFNLSDSDWDSSTEVWGPEINRLISLINKEFLCSKKSLYLPKSKLSMRVELFFWTGDADRTNDNNQHLQVRSFQVNGESPLHFNPEVKEKVHETATDNAKYEYTLDSLSHSRFIHDLQCMYEEGILSDFILRASSKEFHVHKSILSARSPVFRAMFTTAMREKESNFIEIPDVDADALQKMLLFIYLNRIEEDMTWESAMSLYFAADKYAIDELKRASCSLLKAGLCASNACEILVYADLHGDQDLKSTTKNFIIDNDSQVIGSENWNQLLKNNIHLTVEIFSELYVKKIKK